MTVRYNKYIEKRVQTYKKWITRILENTTLNNDIIFEM